MVLTRDERRRAIEAAVDEASGHVPVVAGIGELGTDDAVKLAQDAKAIGAAAGLLSAASYMPLAEEEVFEHFRTVAVESGLPIVNDPDRFRMTMTFDEQTDGKTVLTMRQLHPSRERRQVFIGFGAVEYGLQALDGLAVWLDG